jgi:hypothetical protein
MLKYCGAIRFYLLKCEYIRKLKLILEPFNDGIEKFSPGSTITSSGGGYGNSSVRRKAMKILFTDIHISNAFI